MLSKKYFEKKKWSWSFQEAISFCEDCDYFDDCELGFPKDCETYKIAKSKLQHLRIYHESFERAKIKGIRGLLNAYRTVFIVPGRRSPSLFTDIPYLKINCNNFKQVFRYDKYLWQNFVQESMIIELDSKQGISREDLYFAFKCLNGGVEFFAPLDYIRDQNSACYCLRNDKLTIYIAPMIDYIEIDYEDVK